MDPIFHNLSPSTASPLSIHYASDHLQGIKTVSPKHSTVPSSSTLSVSSSASPTTIITTTTLPSSVTTSIEDTDKSVTKVISPDYSSKDTENIVVIHDPTKRLVDEFGYRFRSCCISLVFPEDYPRIVSEISSSLPESIVHDPLAYYKQIRVVLGSSTNRPGTWIIPGGGIEPNETPTEAAVREAIEELGIIGPVYPIGWLHTYKKKSRALMYMQHVTKLLPINAQDQGFEDGLVRQRILVPLMEVEKKLALSYYQLVIFRLTILLFITNNNVPLVHSLMNKHYLSFPILLTDDLFLREYPLVWGSNREECLRSIQRYVTTTTVNCTVLSSNSETNSIDTNTIGSSNVSKNVISSTMAVGSSSSSIIEQWNNNTSTRSLLYLPHYILCDNTNDAILACEHCSASPSTMVTSAFS